MHPQAPNPSVGFNLPPPNAETAVAQSAIENALSGTEAAQTNAEFSPVAQQPFAPAIRPLPPSFATNAPSHGTNNDVATTTLGVDTSTTSDEDLIEKEWVNRAKTIVEKTQNNPHQQSKDLNHLRAEYLQQQYNKNIKLSE